MPNDEFFEYMPMAAAGGFSAHQAALVLTEKALKFCDERKGKVASFRLYFDRKADRVSLRVVASRDGCAPDFRDRLIRAVKSMAEGCIA